MTLENLLDKQAGMYDPIHGRELMTVAYLLEYNGYTFLATEVKKTC
jgi:hypothetical protein